MSTTIPSESTTPTINNINDLESTLANGLLHILEPLAAEYDQHIRSIQLAQANLASQIDSLQQVITLCNSETVAFIDVQPHLVKLALTKKKVANNASVLSIINERLNRLIRLSRNKFPEIAHLYEQEKLKKLQQLQLQQQQQAVSMPPLNDDDDILNAEEEQEEQTLRNEPTMTTTITTTSNEDEKAYEEVVTTMEEQDTSETTHIDEEAATNNDNNTVTTLPQEEEEEERQQQEAPNSSSQEEDNAQQ